MSVLLVGNYGVGNLGDEALKEYFLQRFPEVDWQIISANPKPGEYPRLPMGFRSLFVPWRKTLRVYARADGVVFGGGSLFTDIESPRACFLWFLHGLAAWIFRKPIFLAFQGIGPFRTRRAQWCARWIARRVAFISVRDPASFDRVARWGLNTKIVQTFDPVLWLLQKEKQDDRSKNILILIPRKNSGESFLKKARELVHQQRWEGIHILSMEPDDPKERAFVARIASEFSAEVIPVRTLKDLCNHLGGAGMVLSERYHGALAALALGKPLKIVSQGEGDKLSSLRFFDLSLANEDLASGESALREALRKGRASVE